MRRNCGKLASAREKTPRIATQIFRQETNMPASEVWAHSTYKTAQSNENDATKYQKVKILRKKENPNV